MKQLLQNAQAPRAEAPVIVKVILSRVLSGASGKNTALGEHSSRLQFGLLRPCDVPDVRLRTRTERAPNLADAPLRKGPL